MFSFFYQEIEDEQTEKENKELDDKHAKLSSSIIKSKATLVICPASLISQWESEVKKRLKSDVLRVLVYHGSNRGRSAKS